MASTKIEWADAVWNPVTGCSKVSEGCRNCYAERLSHRFGWTKKPWTAANAEENVQLHPERLEIPLHWRKPKKVFVNSMSDLFHEAVPDEFIDKVFGVMLACRVFANRPDHVFQILTKRPERMLAYLTSASPAVMLQRWAKAVDFMATVDDPDVLFSELVYSQCLARWSEDGTALTYPEPWSHPENLFPLPNVWLGVSVENQKAADERIPLLLETPAAMRFVSCEPLLGPVDLTNVATTTERTWTGAQIYRKTNALSGRVYRSDYKGPWVSAGSESVTGRVDWVIVGGESGPGARPMHPDWVRSLRDQCEASQVHFFFKQWGEWAPVHELRCNEPGIKGKPWFNFDPETSVCRIGKKKADRLLDGRTWDEFPGVKEAAKRGL